MPEPVYDHRAKRRTVSLTINADLMAKAKQFGLNASRIVEEALASAVEAKARQKTLDDIAADMAFLNGAVEMAGSFSEQMQQFYAERADAEAV